MDSSVSVASRPPMDRIDRSLGVERRLSTVCPEYARRTQRAGGVNDLQRDEAASWLLSLTAHFEFSNETYFLALDYLDRFLSIVKVKRRHLLLLATSCFMVASKMQEESDDQPTLAELVSVGNQTFSASDLLRMETMVCAKLKWDLATVTPYNFLHQYCTDLVTARILSSGDADRVLREATRTLEHTSLYDFLQYPASLRALCALLIAVQDVAGSRAKADSISDRACARLQGHVALPPKVAPADAVRMCTLDMRFVLSEVEPCPSL